jgi:hypothetical protein
VRRLIVLNDPDRSFHVPQNSRRAEPAPDAQI